MESSGSRGAGAPRGGGGGGGGGGGVPGGRGRRGGGGGGGGGDRRGRGGPRTPERCGEDEEDMRSHHLAVLGLLACAAPARAPVRPGIEVLLADSLALVAHRRVGLLTNQTGVDRAGRRDVDLLRGMVTVLFSPEHGFAGTADRPDLPDATDSTTGLPIYSLYRATPAAARAALAALDGVDVLVVDLQDIGARYYTYAATAAWLMRAAARRH